MSLKGCGRDWRRGWCCTTSASGSTTNLVALGWHLPTCWGGELAIHTKRLTPFAPASTELTITDKRVPVHKPGVSCISDNSVPDTGGKTSPACCPCLRVERDQANDWCVCGVHPRQLGSSVSGQRGKGSEPS